MQEWQRLPHLAPQPRPPAPLSTEATGIVRHGFFGTDTINWSITLADIARFLVEPLDSLRYPRARVTVSD